MKMTGQIVFFTHLPEWWGATSVLLHSYPVTMLHKRNFDIDDKLDTVVTCASYQIRMSGYVGHLFDLVQLRMEQKAQSLNAEYYTPHTEIGQVKNFSGLPFTIMGGTYSTEEVGAVSETTYINLNTSDGQFVDVIEISTTVPLSHTFESEPEIEQILDNMIIAAR